MEGLHWVEGGDFALHLDLNSLHRVGLGSVLAMSYTSPISQRVCQREMSKRPTWP